MKLNITSKNFNPSESLKNKIELKFGKLDKYFAKDTEANVVLIGESGGRDKLEATIHAAGMIFRAEDTNSDIYYCLDNVIDKLSSQMSRFKKKLIKKHKAGGDFIPQELPEVESDDEIKLVKTKRYTLTPMTSEEAILQMELIAHDFFVYKDAETGGVNVVYKRKDGGYGLLETE